METSYPLLLHKLDRLLEMRFVGFFLLFELAFGFGVFVGLGFSLVSVSFCRYLPVKAFSESVNSP
jgi:hypothetical protein